MDYSLPGSSLHGILQARILEWVSMTISKDLPDPGVELTSLTFPALVGGFFTTNDTWENYEKVGELGLGKWEKEKEVQWSQVQPKSTKILLVDYLCQWTRTTSPTGITASSHSLQPTKPSQLFPLLLCKQYPHSLCLCMTFPGLTVPGWAKSLPSSLIVQDISLGKDFALCNAHVCSVAQLCPTLCNPRDCSPPDSSVYGVFQAQILEQFAIFHSRDCPNPGIEPTSPESCIGQQILYHWATWEVPCKHTIPESIQLTHLGWHYAARMWNPALLLRLNSDDPTMKVAQPGSITLKFAPSSAKCPEPSIKGTCVSISPSSTSLNGVLQSVKWNFFLWS